MLIMCHAIHVKVMGQRQKSTGCTHSICMNFGVYITYTHMAISCKLYWNQTEAFYVIKAWTDILRNWKIKFAFTWRQCIYSLYTVPRFKDISIFGKLACNFNHKTRLLQHSGQNATLLLSGMHLNIPHDDVIKWKHFPRHWPFVRGIHRSPVNSPQKGQWRGALMFSLICVWINGWVNNREAGGYRRYCAHYDIIVMINRMSAALLGLNELRHGLCGHCTPWAILSISGYDDTNNPYKTFQCMIYDCSPNSSLLESVKTMYNENVSTGVLDKNKEHYSRCKDNAQSYDVLRHIQLRMSK